MWKLFGLVVVAVGMLCGTSAMRAQWVIHSLGGTVESLQPARKTMYVITDDGSGGNFQFAASPDVNVSFDKDVRLGTMSADKFTAQGDHVILFYFGDGRVRTAYSVLDVGKGPFVKETGTVESYDKHSRMLTVKTKAGADEAFVVSDKTVVDTADGVANGKKLHLSKGDPVRVLAQSASGSNQALLVRTGGIDPAI
jgi:hypothetical protein